MSKYHAAMMVFLGTAALLGLSPLHGAGAIAAWTMLLAGMFALLAIGSAFPQWQFYLPVVNRVAAGRKVVCLTFDDGPDPEVTPKLLALLKAEKVPATFFFIGKACEAHPEWVRKTHEAGHRLGNHSYGHLTYWAFMPVKAIRREIEQANQVLFKITGQLPKFYRPPFSVTRPGLGAVLEQLNMTCVGWDVRALEGMHPDSGKMVERILRRVRPGSIIMLHERYYSRTGFDTDALIGWTRTMIESLRQKGYGFVSLDELLAETKGQ